MSTKTTQPKQIHTPAPWSIEWQCGSHGQVIPGCIRSHANTTDFVAGLNSCKPEDAEFAVRAVNCHDDLMAALHNITRKVINNEPVTMGDANQAMAALAKAGA